MKKIKRLLALGGALLLLFLYIITLIFALAGSPASPDLFKASVAASVIVPVLLYGYMLTARVLKGKGGDLNGRKGETDGPSDTSDR